MMIRKLLFVCLCGSLLFGAITDGNKTVTTGGTAETLVASSTRAKWVLIQADCDNTNNAYVGWDSTPKTAGGVELDACESVRYEPPRGIGYYDLVDIYVDVDTDGEGVHYQYETY